MLTEAEAWQVLRTVPDPEIPVISVCELGIVRSVRAVDDAVTVVVTPTYSGCPATEVIATSIRTALSDAGAATVAVETRLSPAWTTDWIEAAAAERLKAYGIVPPGPAAVATVQPIRLVPRSIGCPRCGSRRTTRLAAFGSTACKALWRCDACMEPFEEFKPL
ncbi:MAG: phenylacetate-CoA oxygenase subunit PaaJ [Burkholderiales bacterium]|nr:phenylacetate-CoA oxygenase subunit PaaJ [Burkholderiales bacterium]